MKRIIFIFSMFCFFSGLFFAGEKITILSAGDVQFGNSSLFKETIKKFNAEYPSVEVEMLAVDQTTGATITMDALLAAGDAPNIYYDSMVRAGKYMVKDYALDLRQYITDLKTYNPGLLATFTKNGALLGLPMPGSSQGMFINLDIMKEIGYTIANDWTITDFLKMAELVKQKYNGKKYATGMFAANQSGDYLINNWFAAFGVPFYENGNYDKPVMADRGGAKVYAFYQLLMKNGYIQKDAASIGDEEFIVQWFSGNIAATAFFQSWAPTYYESALAQGVISKIPNYKFVAFPRAPGVQKVPTYTNGYGVVIHKTGTKLDKYASRFVEILNSAEMQGNCAKFMNLSPNRTDATHYPTDAHLKEIENIIAVNGVMDVGLSDPRFPERRATQFPILQKVLTFKMTPEEAITEYQKKMAAVK